ncbi:MAG: glycosyltransferase family 4 protein [Eubacteriales bacterium]|nr:glycosyltransferase family 4 protein [Eubacteriales bacterium]
MKILITTDWYVPAVNGVVTSVLNLEKELRKKGHEVKILTLSQNRHSHVSGHVTYIGSVGAGKIYPNARVRIAVRSKYVTEIMEWQPDIIHSQCEFSTFLYARHIAKVLNIPIVHTYHTVYEDYTHYFSPFGIIGKKAVRTFSRWCADSCEVIIVPTEKVKELLESYGIDAEIQVIPSGINLDKFNPKRIEKDCLRNEISGISEEDFVCVYIGRLAKEKNIDELITMHHDMKEPNVKLLIVGDGPDRENLEKLVEKYGMTDCVIFTGMVSPKDIEKYYKLGDVFVSGSTSETQGLTYVEALASGLPVVCRQDKCLDGVIEDHFNGYQYTDSEEYQKWIFMLLKDAEFRETMSYNALLSSKKFGSDCFVNAVEELYETKL